MTGIDKVESWLRTPLQAATLGDLFIILFIVLVFHWIHKTK